MKFSNGRRFRRFWENILLKNCGWIFYCLQTKVVVLRNYVLSIVYSFTEQANKEWQIKIQNKLSTSFNGVIKHKQANKQCIKIFLLHIRDQISFTFCFIWNNVYIPQFIPKIKTAIIKRKWNDSRRNYVVGSKSFRPDIQKPRQMENVVRVI